MSAPLLRRVGDPGHRPYLFLAATILLLAALDGDAGRFLSSATAFSALQSFATLGPVALGLGMTMLIREFDLSVAGMFGLAGCIAVLAGADNPWAGLAAAVLAGCAFGLVQGLIISGLNLPSVAVSLGGLLTAVGIAYVITEGHALVYANMELSLALNEHIAAVFSARSLVAAAIFVLLAAVVGFTRTGRDMIASGSDRRGALIAGVAVNRIVVGTFVLSGALAALSGALLSYSLASASPSGLSDVLVPAAAAAILGGVSLSGGAGRPLGIAAGVLTLSVMRSGLNAIGAPPFAHDIAMGSILLAVAVLDAPYLSRQLKAFRASARRPAV
jgi:ribose/xylose/arabinose/galactoside ABC-type transport system permease subunit